MNWEELLREESELVHERILELKRRGNSFTYQQIADIWGTATSNTINKLTDMIDRGNGLIEKDTANTPYTIIFHWDKEIVDIEEVEENKKDIPSYINQRTYNNIVYYLSEREIWDEGCDLVFRRGNNWDSYSQRGGLNMILTVNGLPTLELAIRMDNGVILKGSGRIRTVSAGTVKQYISSEMEQAGHLTIASYFKDNE